MFWRFFRNENTFILQKHFSWMTKKRNFSEFTKLFLFEFNSFCTSTPRETFSSNQNPQDKLLKNTLSWLPRSYLSIIQKIHKLCNVSLVSRPIWGKESTEITKFNFQTFLVQISFITLTFLSIRWNVHIFTSPFKDYKRFLSFFNWENISRRKRRMMN